MGHLSVSPRLKDTTEEPDDKKECYEILSSRHGITTAPISSQQPWLPVQGWAHQPSTMDGKELVRCHPPRYYRRESYWEEGA